MEQKRMQIIRFTAENFKKLKAVEIVPQDGQHVLQITGANEAGKSSVLDAIWSILEWSEAKKQIARPIREGTTAASASIDLGDITVTRSWTAGGSYLTVMNKERAVFKSPQAVLDALQGQLTFDPLAFANMKEAEQSDMLLRMTGLGAKILELDQNHAALYSERTNDNRKLRDLLGEQRNMGAVDLNAPDEEVKASDLMARVGEAQTEISKHKEMRRDLEQWRDRIAAHYKEWQDDEDEINALRERQEERNGLIQEIEVKRDAAAKIVELLIDPDIETLMEQASGVDEQNRRVRKKKEYNGLVAAIAAQQKQIDEKETSMTSLLKEKQDLFTSTKMPIPGLAAGAEGVTYKGIPFAQCSASEKLRVSTAIAMALNPTLRVIRITDGSLLDSKNMAELERMAAENGYQIWIEMVDESGKVGVYIEDGEIKPVPIPFTAKVGQRILSVTDISSK